MAHNSLLQSKSQGFTASASANTLQFSNNCTNGSLMAVCVSFAPASGSATVTVADDTNGSYTQAGSNASNGTTTIAWFYYIDNQATNKATITVTPSTSVTMAIAIHEYQVISPHGVSLDSTVSNTGNSATSGSTGTCSVQSGGGDLVVAGLAYEQPGVSVSIDGATPTFALEQTVSDPGGMGATMALATADDWNATQSEKCNFDFGISSLNYAAMAVSFQMPNSHTNQYFTTGYDTQHTFTFTIPSGTRGSILLQCYGGGGSGGGGNAANGGNGGGSGGQSSSYYDSYSVGDVLTIVVGGYSKGGSHASGFVLYGDNGDNGGDATISNATPTVLCAAYGGDGGNGAGQPSGPGGSGAGAGVGNIYANAGCNGQINSGATGGIGCGNGGNGGNQEGTTPSYDGQDGDRAYAYITWFTGGGVDSETGSGGVVVGGQDAVSLNMVAPSTGGVVAGGSAPVKSGLFANGGTLAGGSAVITTILSVTSTGGILIGGLSDQPDPHALYSTGGAVAGGESDPSWIFWPRCTGGAVLGGSASLTYGIAPLSGTGGAVVGGSALARLQDEGQYGDSLRFYFTGASGYAGNQTAQANSLGNYRSTTEAQRIGFLQSTIVSNMNIIAASGWNGTGNGSTFAINNDTLTFTPPDGLTGASTTIEDGYTFVISGTDPSKWVRVLATGDLANFGQLEFVPQFNNVFAFNDEPDTTGTSKYRAVMLQNRSASTITNITFWLNTLADAQTTQTGLPSSGAGSLVGNGTAAFCGWPQKGWARIDRSGLIEIVYYESRSDKILFVESTGRGRLGTSPQAGNSGDIINCVPPIRIANENPSPKIAGPIQTIANETTAPTGVAWSVEITSTSGINAGTLNPQEQTGLWIHRELPADVGATARQLNSIAVSYVINGVTYNETLSGLFRVKDASLQRYELYVGVDTPVDLNVDSPAETFSSFPHTTGITFAPEHTYYLQVVNRDAYDLASPSTEQTIIVNPSGTKMNPPSAPTVYSFAPLNGTFSLMASYFPNIDAGPNTSGGSNQASAFLIYIRYDGTTPNPATDTPVRVNMKMSTNWPGVPATNPQNLKWASTPYPAGTTAKVLVRVLRTSDGATSTNTDVHTATIGTTPATSGVLKVFWEQVAQAT